MNKAILAVAAAVLLAAPAMGAPDPRGDFGDKLFGFEPDPPAPSVPEADIPDASLGAVLELVFSNVSIGDQFAYTLGGATYKTEVLDDGGLQAIIQNGHHKRSLDLPPVDANTDHDFTMLVTPASLVLDRAACTNTAVTRNHADVQEADLCDATLQTYGLNNGITGIVDDETPSKTDPAGVIKPEAASVQATFHRILPVEVPSVPLSMVMVDPDDALAVGPIESFYTGIPLQDTEFQNASDIEGALDINAVTSADLNGVLSALKTSNKALGAVDTASLSNVMEEKGIGLRTITNTVAEPRTVFDTATSQLVLIDGGLGRISVLGDEKHLVIDNDKLTALKDPESAKDTAFHVVASNEQASTAMGTLWMDSKLGSYQSVVSRAKEAMNLGMRLDVAETEALCKPRMQAALDDENQKTMGCLGPSFPQISKERALALNKFTNGSDMDFIAGPDLTSGKRLWTDKGTLANLPSLDGAIATVPVGIFQVDLPPATLDRFTLDDFTLPQSGLAGIPEVDSIDPDAPSIPCTGSCLPGFDPNVLDGIHETFGSASLNGIMPVIPVSEASGVVGQVMGLSGEGFAAVPVDALKQLAPGATSKVVFRVVGSQGSLFGGTGIEAAQVQLESTDPLGLSTSSQVLTTNTNGYSVAALGSMSDWTVKISKEGFETLQGAGQAPLPGSESGEEYEMQAKSDSKAGDVVKNNSLFLVAAAALVVLAVVWYRKNNPKNRK